MDKRQIIKSSRIINLSIIVAIVINFASLQGVAIAGVKGKIAGKITDVESGKPLPGVNVIIEGTELGAATDLKGDYFIINILPGTYTVKASMMGYGIQKKIGIVVNADHTTFINFDLKSAVLDLEEEVIVVAEREVVKMDISSASNVVEAEAIENTPYKGDFDQVLMTQPGWGDWRSRGSFSGNRLGTKEGVGEDQGFEIRGGGENEVNMMLDGISLKNFSSGYQFTKVNLSNIQEVQLLSGGFNAEYGEARSGVINIITKEGESKYSISINTKVSPPGLKHFGPKVNDIHNNVYDYGPRFGFGSYYDPDSLSYISFEGTEYIGNKYFNGWLSSVGLASANHPWYPILQGKLHGGSPTCEDTLLVANFLKEEWLWKHRPELWNYGNKWDRNVEATFSGPVPLVNNAFPTTFFASYRHKYAEWMYPRSGGKDGGYLDYTMQFKLTTNITPNLKLIYNGLRSQLWGGYEYRAGYEMENYAFGHILETPLQEFNQLGRGDFTEQWAGDDWNGLWMKPGYIINLFLHSLNATWVINSNSFLDASLQYSHHWNELVQAELRDVTLIPDEDFIDANNNRIWDVGEQYTDSNGDGVWTAGTYAHRIGLPGYWKYYDEAPWGRLPDQSAFGVRHLNWQDNSYSKTITFKASLTSQIDKHNQFKTGVEVIKNHEYVFRIKPKGDGVIWHFDQSPVRLSGYVQDKLEFKGMIANIGIRIDAFDPSDRYYDFIHHPFDSRWGDGGPGSPLIQTRADSIARVAAFDGGNTNPDIMPDSLMFNPPWQINWSPRLGIAHPVSENAKIFFNYGHFYQPARSVWLFGTQQRGDEKWKLRDAGNPELKMEKTVGWELGYEHNIYDMFRIAISGYHKYLSNIVSRYRYHGLNDIVYLYSWKNNGYRDIRGVELKVDKRIGKFITGWLSYDYLLTSSGSSGYQSEYEYQEGYSYPTTTEDIFVESYGEIKKERSERNQNILPPRSRIRFNIDFHTPEQLGPKFFGIYLFGDWRANFMYSWIEGDKFTYNPEGMPYVEENMQWMGFRQMDAKFSKSIKFGKLNSVIYVEVYNLFNAKNFNMINYFGSPPEDGAPFPELQRIYYDSIIENDFKPGETGKPGIILPWGPEYALFFPKRDIQFGVKLYFE